MIDTVIIRRVRIGHIPHPPSWKASASSFRTVIGSSFGLLSVMRAKLFRPHAPPTNENRKAFIGADEN
jgi:hypothetical protein